VLRLLIDRPSGGVTIDELARVSREIGHLLDAHDVVRVATTSSARRPGSTGR
jgi:ribosome maturation factor RimP